MALKGSSTKEKKEVVPEILSIHGYVLDKPLSTNNSGFSKWGFGEKNGNNYFIKEFLSPVYPEDESIFTPKQLAAKKKGCASFEAEKKELYKRNISMAIVTNKINNDKLDRKYKKPICIVADEFHLFIDEENCEILKNFGSLARRIRKYTGSLIVATQSINDFIGNNDIRVKINKFICVKVVYTVFKSDIIGT